MNSSFPDEINDYKEIIRFVEKYISKTIYRNKEEIYRMFK